MTPPTQPLDGTLLAAFRRHRQLSMFWQRAHCTPEIATQEMLEYCKLGPDIEEMIRRLTAFAELGTDRLCERYASVKAEPPKDTAGQWRELSVGESILEGDERLGSDHCWRPTLQGGRVGISFQGRYRRRIATPSQEPNPEDTGECPTCGGSLTRSGLGLACLACHWTATEPPNVPPVAEKAPESAPIAQNGASGEAWRMLEVGDTIKEGDEYFSSCEEKWKPTFFAESLVTETDPPYRRRVIPAEVKP